MEEARKMTKKQKEKIIELYNEIYKCSISDDLSKSYYKAQARSVILIMLSILGCDPIINDLLMTDILEADNE